jgi:hypothetical protein
MRRVLFVSLMSVALVAQQTGSPDCRSEGGRRAARFQGTVKRGELFERKIPAGWILKLQPDPEGWFLSITVSGREGEDLSRLTPPWHFVPNAREIEGWHFRNAANTGPSDGTVNAPQQLREFIFSPAVGRSIEYHGSGTSPDDVAKVRAFGRGWLFIEKYTLTPPSPGTRAAFEAMTFSVCLTWPAGPPTEPTRR